MKKYALYIHGLGSAANSRSAAVFARYFPDYEWLAPEFDEDPDRSVGRIEEYVKIFSPEILAGTSLGGVYVAYADAPDATKIICNGTVNIEKVLRKHGYGRHPFLSEREDGRKEYEITEELVRSFITFRGTHQIKLGKVNAGIYSRDDEMVGQVESRKSAKILEEAGFNIMWSDKFGHRFNENVAKQIPAFIDGLK